MLYSTTSSLIREQGRRIKIIFPDVDIDIINLGWLHGRSIIAPTNHEVDGIIDSMEGWVLRTGNKLTSTNTLEDYQGIMQFNVEFINILCPMDFLDK